MTFHLAGIYSDILFAILSGILFVFYLVSILAFYLASFLESIWHLVWHSIRHSVCHIPTFFLAVYLAHLGLSIWHPVKHSTSHLCGILSGMHIFSHSFWHLVGRICSLTFYLASVLAGTLTFSLTCVRICACPAWPGACDSVHVCPDCPMIWSLRSPP